MLKGLRHYVVRSLEKPSDSLGKPCGSEEVRQVAGVVFYRCTNHPKCGGHSYLFPICSGQGPAGQLGLTRGLGLACRVDWLGQGALLPSLLMWMLTRALAMWPLRGAVHYTADIFAEPVREATVFL